VKGIDFLTAERKNTPFPPLLSPVLLKILQTFTIYLNYTDFMTITGE
jgi:hypothetical protein